MISWASPTSATTHPPPSPSRSSAEARSLRDISQTPSEIDRRRARKVGAGEPIYQLDRRSASVEPSRTSILTQDLCRVCAVPSGQVQAALDKIGLPDAKVGLARPEHARRGDLDDRGSSRRCSSVTRRAPSSSPSLRQRVAMVKDKAKRLPTIRSLRTRMVRSAVSAGHWIPGDDPPRSAARPVLAEDGRAEPRDRLARGSATRCPR